MRYIKNGIIKDAKNIVIKRDGRQYLNPTEEMILADGWVVYTPEPKTHTKSRMQVVQELVTKQWNERTDISNEEALDYMVIVYPFEKLLGQELAQGKIVSHADKLWRVRQTHTAMAEYTPSLDTASLWEVIEREHSGELSDPIPYTPPMEIYANKYYSEDGIIYRCTRDSGVALSHRLAELVGLYVNKIE